jgi:hypothetical protein
MALTDLQVHLVKTSCGDAHNIAFDKDGLAFSLPSPLDFNPFPSDTQHKVRSTVNYIFAIFTWRQIGL